MTSELGVLELSTRLLRDCQEGGVYCEDYWSGLGQGREAIKAEPFRRGDRGVQRV